MSSSLEHTVSELLEPLLKEHGVFLVDMNIRGVNPIVITIYIDAERSGVTVDQCSEISRELDFLMKAHELFKAEYRLDVSSPGLSRPLTDYRQYPKNKGRHAKVKYKENGEYLKIKGRIKEVDRKFLLLETEDGTERELSFKKIVETKIIPVI